MKMGRVIFHLAFPVHDLEKAQKFYVGSLGCKLGRASKYSMILNLHGHQIVAQKVEESSPPQKGIYPRHFGLVFSRLADWKKLLSRIRRKRLIFYQEPRIRFRGTPIEHHTFFLKDPSNNLLEFKHYVKSSAVFGEETVPKVGDRD